MMNNKIKRKNKSKSKNKNKNIMLILIIIISLIVSFGVYKFVSNKLKQRQIIEEKKYYSLKIDIPNTKISSIDNSINNIVSEGKNEVIKKVKKDKKFLKQNKLTCEYITQYEKYTLDIANVNSIVFRTYSYTGGANYESDIYTFYYNDKEQLNLTSFFNDNYLEKISKISKYKLIEKSESNKELVLLNEEELNKGLEPTEENFKNIYFTSDGLEIIFEKYQVAAGYLGDIKIKIPYSEIKDILKIPVEEKKEENSNNNVSKRDLSQMKEKKLIAFTFDDGPAYKKTERILDELKLRNVKASFFLLGSRVADQAEIVKRMYEEGHTIGSHTYSHRNLKLLNNYETYKEIQDTNEAINSVIGIYPKFLRPPYGNLNDYIKDIYKNPIVLWSIDTEDWKNRNANKIKDNILNNAKDGSIILLHDLYETSIDGAILAMDELIKNGSEIVSLEEMFMIKGIPIDNNIEKYFNF